MSKHETDRADTNPSASQPARSPGLGLICLLLATLTMLFGAGLIFLTRFGPVVGLPRPELGTAFILLFAGIACLWLGVRLAVTGHKLRARSADEVVAASDKQPILYLRSFALDATDAQNKLEFGYGIKVPINPWEASVAAGVSGAGPLIAIGRPGEKLATTGAS